MCVLFRILLLNYIYHCFEPITYVSSHVYLYICTSGWWSIRIWIRSSNGYSYFWLETGCYLLRLVWQLYTPVILDLSRALDTLNHDLLWQKLISIYICSAWGCWSAYLPYRNLKSVWWGRALGRLQIVVGSETGRADLSGPIWPVGLKYVNNLSYADVIVLQSPTIRGLRHLISIF